MKRTMLRAPLALLLLLVLAACGGDVAPTATPLPTSPPVQEATNTAAPAQATATAPAATETVAPAPAAPDTATPAPPATATAAPPPATPTAPGPPATPTAPGPPAGPQSSTGGALSGVSAAPPGATFVVPPAPATAVPGIVAVSAVVPGAGQPPDYTAELKAYWALFYQARTLAPGGHFDLAGVGNLTAPPYRDYTLALLDKSQADVDAGKLQQVSYSDVSVQSARPRAPGPDGKPAFDVQISRTQSQVRTDSQSAPQTLTLQFRLTRTDLGNGQVGWQAYDFFNPTTNAWLSDTLAAQVPTAQVQREVLDYFAHFYAARSLAPGGRFDLASTEGITAGAYQDYTLPLLKGQQADADAGKVQAVSYSDIGVKLLNWDPLASSHGGLATVAVTRTSHTQRPGQPPDVQTATYQFRVHRHLSDAGTPFWLAVDFLSPITNRWVSESAGLSGPIPPAGHG